MLVAVGLVAGGLAVAQAVRAVAAGSTPAPGRVYSMELRWQDPAGDPWSQAELAGLKADGLNTVMINMSWGDIETAPNTYDWTDLDTDMANAAAVGISVNMIFFSDRATNTPAPWVLGPTEESSAGVADANVPSWWNTAEQQAYFSYLTTAIDHVKNDPAFVGETIDWGNLDAYFDGGGYSADDVNEFHSTYLPQTYGTIAAFNSKFGTSDSSFDDVPAVPAGQPGWGVYQAFLDWSLKTTYTQLATDATAAAPGKALQIYQGGQLAAATTIINDPDTIYQVAKQFNATVIDDANNDPGWDMVQASLARAYGVKMMGEWTIPHDPSQGSAQLAQGIMGSLMAGSNYGGDDYVIFNGPNFKNMFPIFTGILPALQGLTGDYPVQQQVAIYLDVSQEYGNEQGGSLAAAQGQMGTLWADSDIALPVVTSEEIANGVAKLSNYKAIYPINNRNDANVQAFQAGGGTVLTDPGEIGRFATAYGNVADPNVLQMVPNVPAGGTSADIVLTDISATEDYNSSLSLRPAGLGMAAGTYHLVNAAGVAVPQTVQPNGDVCATASLSAASITEWTMAAGAAPSGTAAASCPPDYTGAFSVTATAGQVPQGMTFRAVGSSNAGDGGLATVTENGMPAVETLTSAQSGASDAAVYLQADPASAVEESSGLSLTVTYWDTPGQGFAVQYNSPTTTAAGGPLVAGTGSGTWTTVTVPLTGARLDNGLPFQADLRLVAKDPTQPLIVQKVTLSVSNAITGFDGLCLDDRGASTANFNPVQVYTCNGTAAQQWTAGSDGTLRTLGKCLDVDAAGTTNGTTVDLYQCNSTLAQVWQPTATGSLVNPHSGLCLDDTGHGGAGTQAQIWSCTGGSNQKWVPAMTG